MGVAPMSVGDADVEPIGAVGEAPSPELEWMRDRGADPSRVTVFDPSPARLDTAWIELDAGSIVALRAMR